MIKTSALRPKFAKPLAVLAFALTLCQPACAAPDTQPQPAEASPSRESNITSVIELFTSEGCSSCPPADALLKTYATKPGVLALSMHVDYWDYLGWKDTLGSPKYTERQRNYAKARSDGQVYTPQVVINGITHANGASSRDIEAALATTQAQTTANRVPLMFWTDRGNIMIETGGAAPSATAKEATVWLAIVQKSADVVIKRGENAGKTVNYINIVRELTPVGTWTGQPMKIQLARSAIMRPQLDAVVVFLQQGKAGPIIAAAETGLW
jgi:hypothetical protein